MYKNCIFIIFLSILSFLKVLKLETDISLTSQFIFFFYRMQVQIQYVCKYVHNYMYNLN